MSGLSVKEDDKRRNYPPEVEEFGRDQNVIWEMVREDYLVPLDTSIEAANRITAFGFPNFQRLIDPDLNELIVAEHKLTFMIERAKRKQSPRERNETMLAKTLVAYNFVNANPVQQRASMNILTEIAWSWLLINHQIETGGWEPECTEGKAFIAEIERHIAAHSVLSDGRKYHGIFAMKELWDREPSRLLDDISDTALMDDGMKYRALMAKASGFDEEQAVRERKEQQRAKHHAKLDKLYPQAKTNNSEQTMTCLACAEAPEMTLMVMWRGVVRRLPEKANETLLDCLAKMKN